MSAPEVDAESTTEGRPDGVDQAPKRVEASPALGKCKAEIVESKDPVPVDAKAKLLGYMLHVKTVPTKEAFWAAVAQLGPGGEQGEEAARTRKFLKKVTREWRLELRDACKAVVAYCDSCKDDVAYHDKAAARTLGLQGARAFAHSQVLALKPGADVYGTALVILTYARVTSNCLHLERELRCVMLSLEMITGCALDPLALLQAWASIHALGNPLELSK